MKSNVIILAVAVAALTFTGCKSSKNITPEKMGNVEVELPCAKYDHDTEEYFTGMGVGENVNMQNARLAALNAAKSMINAKLGGLAKGLATDYVRTQAGAAQQDDVQRIAEREVTAVIERLLNDAEQTSRSSIKPQAAPTRATSPSVSPRRSLPTRWQPPSATTRSSRVCSTATSSVSGLKSI